MEVNPLSIIFVKSDSKGDRLLFRYPSAAQAGGAEAERRRSGRHNPYALTITEDLLQNPLAQNIHSVSTGVSSSAGGAAGGGLASFTDEVLSTLFAVKAELCNCKFELKVNDVRFVGHPTLLPYRSKKDDTASMILINIVFALQASASHSIVKCYYDLSKRLGKALRHEEKRCSYLSEEMKIMMAAVDDTATLDSEGGDSEREGTAESEEGSRPSPFHVIRQKSSLARSLVQVFEELTTTGIVQARINNWVLVSFCLPHKAHQTHNAGLPVEPETIDKCLSKLKPYHGMLLLVDPNELLDSMPLDSSTALLRLVELYSPLKSLQTIALEAALPITQVFQLTGHLVYWAQATIIYPLCASNVYVVAPGADTRVNSPLVEAFSKEFPSLCLLQVLAMFSLPAPLWYHARCGAAGGGADGARLARVTAWLLRRRLLLQLHTYVQFNMSDWGCVRGGKEYYCEKHSTYSAKLSDSVASLSQNVPEPIGQYGESHDHYPTTSFLNQTDFSHSEPIVIDSDRERYEVDSANNSLEDGVDTVDGFAMNGHSQKLEVSQKKANGASFDSGLGMNNVESQDKGQESGNEGPQRQRTGGSNVGDGNNNGLSLNLKAQNEMMSFQPPTVIWNNTLGCDTIPAPGATQPPPPPATEAAILSHFSEEERASIFSIPAAHNPEDLALLAQLHKKGLFRGEHHLEEIMFYENLTRSQILTLIDKFRNLLITFETEDPAIAILYSSH